MSLTRSLGYVVNDSAELHSVPAKMSKQSKSIKATCVKMCSFFNIFQIKKCQQNIKPQQQRKPIL